MIQDCGAQYTDKTKHNVWSSYESCHWGKCVIDQHLLGSINHGDEILVILMQKYTELTVIICCEENKIKIEMLLKN